MGVSSTGQTVSSHHSRGSTPRQMPPDRCHLLTTPARGCQASRAKDSTHLACLWASTTRFVIPHHSSIYPFSTPACTVQTTGTDRLLVIISYIILWWLFMSSTARAFQWSEHQLLWRWILLQPRQRGMFSGRPCVNLTRSCKWNELYRCFYYCTFLPFTAPQARQLPPLPGPRKPHTPYDPRKWYSSVPVAKPGCEAPVSTRHETKYDSTTAPSKWVS